ncbi:uncharacterized protein LOC108645395 isoform X19 [Xenopus tropicalis]|uniref:Uncharacterized protein LOC108645395 isoform X19 n=1 Tax=Xenopus tropicalis TaxID=8364 RepID=A0A8J1JBN0_XENTR|nr:uncharacterized protein LOC108645395 isoform X19 [Xenopus tropicalis]
MYLLFYSPFPLPFPPSPLTIPPITFILYSTHAPHIIAPVLLHLYVRSPYSNNVSLSTDYVVVDKEEILRAMRSRKMHRFHRTTTESPKIETTVDYVVVDKEEILRAMHSRKMHRFHRTTTESPQIETTVDYVVVDKEEILRAMHSRKMHRFDRTTTESPKIETTVDYVVVDKEEILRAMHSRKMHRFHRTTTESPKIETTVDYVVVDKEEILRAMHSRKMHRFDRTTTESPKIETTVDYVVVDKEEILRAMHSRKMHRFDRTTTESPKIETTVGKCHYPCTYCSTLLSLCPSRPPHLLSLLSLLFSIVPTPLTLLLLFFSSLLHLYVRSPYSNNVSLSTDYVVVDKEEILRAMHSRKMHRFHRTTTESPKIETTVGKCHYPCTYCSTLLSLCPSRPPHLLSLLSLLFSIVPTPLTLLLLFFSSLLHLYVRSPYSNNVSLSTDYVVVDKEEILRAMRSRKMHRFHRTTTESPKIETTVGKCHYPCTYCSTLLSLCPSRPPHLLSLLSLLFSIVPTPLTLLLLFFSIYMLDLPIPIMSLFQQIMLLWTKRRYCAPCIPEKCIDLIEQQRRVQKLKLLWIMLLWTKKRYCAPCIQEDSIYLIEQQRVQNSKQLLSVSAIIHVPTVLLSFPFALPALPTYYPSYHFLTRCLSPSPLTFLAPLCTHVFSLPSL